MTEGARHNGRGPEYLEGGRGKLSYGIVIGCLRAEVTLLIEKLSAHIPSSQLYFFKRV